MVLFWKRGLELDHEVPLHWKAKLEGNRQAEKVVRHINADRLWWIGLGMTGVGGVALSGAQEDGDTVINWQT